MKQVRVLETNSALMSHVITDEGYQETISGFSIHTVFNGNKEYLLGRRNVTIYPGDFLVLNNGSSRSGTFDSKSPVNAFSIQFNPGFLSDYRSVLVNRTEKLLDNLDLRKDGQQWCPENIYPFKGDMKYNIMHLKNYMDNELEDDLLLQEHLFRCLIDFSKVYHNEVLMKAEKLKFSSLSTRKEVYRRLAIARDYILSNYNKALTLSEIANAACLSVNHLLRTFKDAFNQTPFQFLTRIRLERAQFMLKTSSSSVRNISMEVGFGCSSAFIRAYKRTYSTTPTELLRA
ncbi:AraC family transcriptional regulator [Daejeonella lutea]|uniref:Helix-turn-helix domain-containing protein n=1 Tax=Daejeonella lutea TaxID=572036 RepID=A0A1T5BT96_9SPHI|nr:AraC family transcriptional regulator [Daejeonella lutea]SKB50361.1 Helix-turn-helix domain-containing protein [Daejeonella lutea]